MAGAVLDGIVSMQRYNIQALPGNNTGWWPQTLSGQAANTGLVAKEVLSKKSPNSSSAKIILVIVFIF